MDMLTDRHISKIVTRGGTWECFDSSYTKQVIDIGSSKLCGVDKARYPWYLVAKCWLYYLKFGNPFLLIKK